MSVVSVKNLNKNYGRIKALRNLSFEIEKNEKIALLGCNGAGKSTLLSLIMGLRKQSSGVCTVLNNAPEHTNNRNKVSFLPQNLSFPEHIKVKEILEIVSSHFKKKETQGIIENLDLKDLLERQSYNLSGGERRKVGVAISLLRDPDLLIMDEPTANIDLLGKNKIYEVIENHLKEKSCSFIFSTHEMQEVERLANRVIVLNEGSIVANGSVEEIKNLFGLKRVCFKSDRKDLNFSPFKKHEVQGELHTVFGTDSDEIVKSLFEQGLDFKDLKIFETSLEEIFVNLWTKSEGIT